MPATVADARDLLEAVMLCPDLMIVFNDEGKILQNQTDPDIAYSQLIRPCKNLLGPFYIEHRSTAVDLKMIGLTLVATVPRQSALAGVAQLMRASGTNDKLLELAARRAPLAPSPPPGATSLVTSRGGNPYA